MADRPEIVTDRKAFGRRVRNVRAAQRLSQHQLAGELHFKTGGSISKIETGYSAPDIHTLVRLATVLRVDLHWLITGQASPALHDVVDEYNEAVNRFAPYLGDTLTYLLEKRITYEQERKDLLRRKATKETRQAIQETHKALASVNKSISAVLADLDWIQHGLEDDPRYPDALKSPSGTDKNAPRPPDTPKEQRAGPGQKGIEDC